MSAVAFWRLDGDQFSTLTIDGAPYVCTPLTEGCDVLVGDHVRGWGTYFPNDATAVLDGVAGRSLAKRPLPLVETPPSPAPCTSTTDSGNAGGAQ